jgi:signal transduction histidine kinase
MLRNAVARLRSVRLRVTIVATLVTGVALTASAIALVSAVEHRLQDQIRSQTEQTADRVAVALQTGTPYDQALAAPSLGTAVYIVGPGGQILASTIGGAVGQSAPAGYLPPDVRYVTTGGVEIAAHDVDRPGDLLRVIAASPLAEVQRSVSELSRLLWVGIPVLVALVGGLAWVLAGRALTPVDRLRAEVDEISHSTLHRRVAEPASGDEVARLAHTMNAMLDRLEGAADRQRQFVSDASHELRSPLATIRAKVEVAAIHPVAADWTDVSGTVLGEVDRLDDLVGDLLQLARLDETGGTLPTTADVDLDELATAEVRRLRGLGTPVDDHGVGAARVQGDRAGLGRALRNLVDNAARHAHREVAVGVAVDGPDAVVTVDDDGPGVPAGERERVFERFTRLDEGRARGAGGAGLGLALVRAVALAHGGTARVLDSPLGGARFELRLPM